MWYPITGGLAAATLPGADNVALAVQPEDAPKPSELTNWLLSEKDLSVKQSLSLGFSPFSADEDGDHRTIVLDAARYAEVDNVRWGVTMRFTLHAWSEHTTIKGSVALVAAQAELNMAYTRTSFQVLGYKHGDLANSLPSFQQMNVANYGDLQKALDECEKVLFNAPDDAITPVPIAVYLQTSEEDHKQGLWPFHLHHRAG